MKNIDLKNHLEALAEKGLRADGRKDLLEIRDIKIQTGVLEHAEGSARIQMGDNDVIVGVKLSLGTPFPDKPEDGVIITMAEELPVADPEWEPGPPGEHAVELARVIDRGLRESGVIDTGKLCITPGELVWMVNVDVYPLNYDGNLVDAGSLAALAALKTATFPKREEDKVLYEEERTKKKLSINAEPVTVTVYKMGEHLLVDATKEEESVSDTRLSVAITQDDKIHSLQKAGFGGLTTDEVFKSFSIALDKSKAYRKAVEKI